MKIIVTIANRTYDPEYLEVVTAWDQDSIDENYQGWKDDKAEQLRAWGSDLLHHVDVELEIDGEAVFNLFNTAPKPIDVHGQEIGKVDE